MTSQLDQFCALFQNELVLQDHLVELLNKNPDITGVRKLQGVSERGKDIIFYEEAPFGRKRLNACVVKNTSITGSVGSATGARTILFQAQQALDTPYTNTIGVSERVEHVFVISPKPITPDAIESVKGGLEARCGQVTFLCGSDLLDVFKKYWPELLAFEGDFLARYLNDLRLHLDSNPVMSSIVLRHSIVEPATQMLSEVYVDQSLQLHLREYRSKALSWYTDLFMAKVSLSEAEDAAFNLEIAANILMNARLWLEPARVQSGVYAAAAGLLRDIALGLPRMWEAGYRKLMLQFEGQTPPRSMAEVKLLPDATLAVGDYLPALKLAKDCWESLVTLIDEHHSKIRQMPHNILSMLSDPLFMRHCALVEVADRIPLAISKTDWALAKSISAELFSDLTQSILLTAPAGFGKTSFCKFNALKDSTRLLEGKSAVLPVFVPLHQFSSRVVTDAADLFWESTQIRELLFSKGKASVPFKRVRLYLDGLDEVANVEQRRAIINAATTVRLSWPVQVIITARDHVYDDYLVSIPRVKLCGFGPSEVALVTRKWLKQDVSKCEAFESQISDHAPLKDLMTVPLLATLLLGVFRKTQQLPTTKVALYDMCVDLLCGGWDLVKNVQRRGYFPANVKLTFLKALAGSLHLQKLRHAEFPQIEVALRESMSQLEHDPESILEETLRDGLLVRSGRVYLFSHFSFQEFLAAKNFNDPTGRKQGSALKRYLMGDDWWADTIRYYIGMLDNPQTAYLWVQTVATSMKRSEKNRLQSELRDRCLKLKTVIETAYPWYTCPTVYP